MPHYKITGRGIATRRKRTREYFGYSIDDVRVVAEADGTQPTEIVELEPKPATQAQLDYAKDLGLSLSPNVSKDDLSDLLSCRLDQDKPATDRHKKFAKPFRIEFGPYTGKKRLFSRLFYKLCQENDPVHLVKWFVFRVYRSLVKGAYDTDIDSPDDPAIVSVAGELVKDERVLKSIKRYDGEDLIFFGEFTTHSGYIVYGGSKNTMAYKSTKKLLFESLNIKNSSKSSAKMLVSNIVRSQNGSSVPLAVKRLQAENKTQHNDKSEFGLVLVLIALILMFITAIVI